MRLDDLTYALSPHIVSKVSPPTALPFRRCKGVRV
jgi:hypothetical protein